MNDNTEPKYAIFAAATPRPEDYYTYDEWMANIATLKASVEAGTRVVAPNGEDITDLVGKPETHATVWNRFNGKAATADDGDLVPKPEAHNIIWDRFNGRLKDGKAA